MNNTKIISAIIVCVLFIVFTLPKILSIGLFAVIHFIEQKSWVLFGGALLFIAVYGSAFVGCIVCTISLFKSTAKNK